MKICFLLVQYSTFLPSGLIIFIFETCQPFSPKKSDQTDGNVYLKSGTNKNLTILDSSILLILKTLKNEHARLAFLNFFLKYGFCKKLLLTKSIFQFQKRKISTILSFFMQQMKKNLPSILVYSGLQVYQGVQSCVRFLQIPPS